MAFKLLKKKNYLALIRNSVKGENWIFRNLYAEVNGQETDILHDGRWSCAIFVSSVLYLSKLIKDLHANVGSTVEDMLKSGWVIIDEPREGAVIVWEARTAKDNGRLHGHMGFFMGDERAVSNDSQATGFPVEHHFTYNDTRKIEKILWHPSLDEN